MKFWTEENCQIQQYIKPVLILYCVIVFYTCCGNYNFSNFWEGREVEGGTLTKRDEIPVRPHLPLLYETLKVTHCAGC